MPGKDKKIVNELLNVIPSAQKDGKNILLEKEIQKFNALIADIKSLRMLKEEIESDEELYRQLFLKHVLPILSEIALASINLVEKMEIIFFSSAFSKHLELCFVEKMISLLIDWGHYADLVLEKLLYYQNWQSSLDPIMKSPVFEERISSQKDLSDDYEEPEKFRNEFKRNNNEDRIDLESASLSDLYKDVAKLVHPDLEQDENKKEGKGRLMNKLSDARDNEDLYAMLQIKKEALQNSDPLSITGYTLKEVKVYNSMLKKEKAKINLLINRKPSHYQKSGQKLNPGDEKNKSADLRIKNDKKNLRALKESILFNTRNISSASDLKEFIT